jgi:mannonate dehydratase
MTEAAQTIHGDPEAPKAGIRWFGPADVPIMMIAQIPGVTEVVSALHHVPNGDEWTVAEILKRKIEVEFQDMLDEPSGLAGAKRDEFYKEQYRSSLKSGKRTGLVWSTIESLPFTEEIKNGSPERDAHIATYQKSLDNIGAINRLLKECGAPVYSFTSVMGNFMLVADWTRTGYATLPDGSRALEYIHTHFAAFDIFMAHRHHQADGSPNLEAYEHDGSYSAAEIKAAQAYWNDTLKDDRKKQEALADMIVAGLPGAQASFGPNAALEGKLTIFREAVLKYKGMTVETLRANIDYFLKHVVPNAKAAGVMMCSHPDDPAYSPFLGTPRAVGDAQGYKFLLDRGCGVGLCFGSLTPNEKNRDVMSVVKDLAEHGLAKGLTIEQIFPFVHLRPVETNGRDFREGLHAAHIDELWKIVYALASYGWKGVFRPDHAPDPAVLHDMMTQATGNSKALGSRGYSVPGRAMGANLLIGLFHGARQMVGAGAKKADFDIIRNRASHIILPHARKPAKGKA